mgnify:CR=1 FL=1
MFIKPVFLIWLGWPYVSRNIIFDFNTLKTLFVVVYFFVLCRYTTMYFNDTD